MLFIRLQGAAVLGVTNPSGRSIAFDTTAGLYSRNIPGAIALHRHQIVSPHDPNVHTGMSDMVQIDDAQSGTYLVSVRGRRAPGSRSRSMRWEVSAPTATRSPMECCDAG